MFVDQHLSYLDAFADVSIQVVVTQGFGGLDNANITNIMAGTGLILGAGIQVDGSGNPISESGNVRLSPFTNWRQSLFSCASVLKASVKRVTFQSNGTASLSNLKIIGIQQINYPSNNSKPLWAVENTGLNIEDVAPFWGLVSPDYANSPSLYTIQKESLYLPAGLGSVWGMVSTDDSSAGALAPAGVLSSVFDSIPAGVSLISLPDYSGKTSYPMFLKWKALSGNASSVGSIINLLWMDIMANAVLSSKSVLSRNGTSDLASIMARVTPFQHTINYNYFYAIPAFCFLLLYLFSFLIFLICVSTARARMSTLRMLLNQTSAGRAVTTERDEKRLSPYAGTNDWVSALGDEKIKIRIKDGRGEYTGLDQDIERPQCNVNGIGSGRLQGDGDVKSTGAGVSGQVQNGGGDEPSSSGEAEGKRIQTN